MNTAQLLWKAHIRSAHAYVKYLDARGDKRIMWEQFYHITDLPTWAEQRIENILTSAADAYDDFKDDAEAVRQATMEASSWLDALREAGFADLLPKVETPEWAF